MVSTTSIISEQLILNAGRTMFRGPQVGYLQCIFFSGRNCLRKSHYVTVRWLVLAWLYHSYKKQQHFTQPSCLPCSCELPVSTNI